MPPELDELELELDEELLDELLLDDDELLDELLDEDELLEDEDELLDGSGCGGLPPPHPTANSALEMIPSPARRIIGLSLFIGLCPT